jgi:hypothetical protein
MKTLFKLLVMAAFYTGNATAQVKITEAVREVKPLDVPVNIAYDVTDIEVFEQFNYAGKTGRFRIEGGKLIPPFKPMTSVSFKVPDGKIVYLKFCTNEFPYETAYTSSQTKADLSGVCGIRSDDVKILPVQFNGLSTVIHNNDCRRVFGSVHIKVFEIAPDGASQSYMRCNPSTSFPGPDAFTFNPFTVANANVRIPYRNLLFDENPRVPTINTIVNSMNGGEAIASFKVGANALSQGRVKVLVTSNIGSAHKTCDLCDDFSSNVRMEAPVSEAFPLNKTYSGSKIVDAAHNKVVLGPYKAKGRRDGSAITASAGTLIDFRVHLTVAGL